MLFHFLVTSTLLLLLSLYVDSFLGQKKKAVVGSFINGEDKGVGVADHQQRWSEELMRVKYILHIAGDATHILFLCMGCTPIGIVLYILLGESKIIQ